MTSFPVFTFTSLADYYVIRVLNQKKAGSERDPIVRDKVLGEFHHYTPKD